MNKAGIEVHELQRPRPSRRKRKQEVMQPLRLRDWLWVWGCVAGTFAFWGVVVWVFS